MSENMGSSGPGQGFQVRTYSVTIGWGSDAQTIMCPNHVGFLGDLQKENIRSSADVVCPNHGGFLGDRPHSVPIYPTSLESLL